MCKWQIEYFCKPSIRIYARGASCWSASSAEKNNRILKFFVLVSYVETINCTHIDIGTVCDNLVYFNSILFSLNLLSILYVACPVCSTQVTDVRCYIDCRLCVCCCIGSWSTPLGRTYWHWEQVFLRVLRFSPGTVIPPIFHTRLFIHSSSRCMILAVQSAQITHFFLTVMVHSVCIVVRQGKLKW
jgi:hypothetical protein